jgi:hypothetical protein
MGIFYFPTNFVYWEHVQNHEEIKQLFLDKIKDIRYKYKDNHQGLVNGYTSYGIKDNTLLNLLRDYNGIADQVVWNPINQAIKQLIPNRSANPITLKKSVLSDTWFNEYKDGGLFEYHTHVGTHSPKELDGELYIPSFSLIYILHDENKYNTNTFMSPCNMYVSTEKSFEALFDTKSISEIKEGTVLVFPSSLYHSVREVELPNRITIAINVFSSHV